MSVIIQADKLIKAGLKLRSLKNTPHKYDIPQLMSFLAAVFHEGTDGDTDAEVLIYTPDNNRPRFPLQGSYEALKLKLANTSHAHALYYCISSMCPDSNGRYSHKRVQFSALHCVVLDDVGGKINHADLPALFQNPSYVIETSKGNFQYGFILENIIEDHTQATSLVQTLALAGLTDSGGCSATKLVRLPDGRNGKSDPSVDKGLFHVRLIDLNSRRFLAEDLMASAALEVGGEVVTWRAILDGFSPAGAKTWKRYMPIQPQHITAGGVVDSVLEWLSQNDMIISDIGSGWIDIVCPRGHEHSGDNAAGYKPLGRQPDPYRRMFNCFHDTCKNENTLDFFGYVLANSNIPYLGFEDLSAGLLTNNVFDEQQNGVWRLRDGEPVSFRLLDGFKNKNNQKGLVYSRGPSGKLVAKYVNAGQQWMDSAYRLAVESSTHAAGEPQIIAKNDTLRINTYRPPPWGKGAYDQNHVDRFNAFLEYLLPEKMERDYFVQWLAAKVQRPQHRGTGIIMCAQGYGVGRSTLSGMLNELFGSYNTGAIGFEDLISPTGFNHWEDKSFVVVSEAKETGGYQESKGARRAYESLKQRVDTTAVKTTLNKKNMRHTEITVTCSYLILTNHEDAVAIPEDDRRFTVMRNPSVPADSNYFVDLHSWIDDPIWAKHVYRWLRTVTVDFKALQLPLSTGTKKGMVVGSLAAPERVVAHIAAYALENRHYYAVTNQLMTFARQALLNYDPEASYGSARITKALGDVTLCFSQYKKRSGGKDGSRVRVFKQALQAGFVDASVDGKRERKANKLPRDLKREVEDSVDAWDMDKLVTYVAENM